MLNFHLCSAPNRALLTLAPERGPPGRFACWREQPTDLTVLGNGVHDTL